MKEECRPDEKGDIMKVRLFQEVADQLGARQGWKAGEGDRVLVNPKMGAVVHVAMCNDDGTPLWDQFLHFEPIGAVTVPINLKGEFGMVRVYRPTIRPDAVYDFSDIDATIERLGATSVEFPRGFPKKGERVDQTARREGEEELNSPILEVRQLGEITPNTTFHPHRIPVFGIKVDERYAGALPPDVNEKILKVTWMSPEQIRECVAQGEINCGMTLAALCLAQNG